MTPRKLGLIILFGTLALLGVLVWIFHPGEKADRSEKQAKAKTPAAPGSPAPGEELPPRNPSAPGAAPVAAPATLSAGAVPPVKSIRADGQPMPPLPADRAGVREVVNHVQFTIRDFRLAVGENPVGDNAEITRALFGDNRKQVRFALPEGSSVNGAGELCDPWGTPYFFHALARDHMEVRSAGPDQKMWTEDDIQQ